MDMLDFLCPEDGNGPKIIKIQVPKVCCGVKTVISKDAFSSTGANYWEVRCSVHLGGSYGKIWQNWETLWEKNSNTNEVNTSSDCVCMSCGMFNEYAVPNVGDKYKCFECRG